MSRFVTFILLLVIGTLSSTSTDDTSSDDDLAEASNGLKEIIISQLNSTVVSAKAKCEKKSLAPVSQAIDNHYNQLVTCFDENVNATELENVILHTLLSTDHTQIPKMFCHRVPALVTCSYDFVGVIRPCLDDGEKYLEDLSKNMTNTLLDFLCRDGQANLNNFLSSGGFQCVKDRMEGLDNCVQNITQSFNSSAETSDSVLFESPDFLTVTMCNFFSKLQTCMVNDLRTCSNQTPANIFDALLSELMNASPCQKLTLNLSELTVEIKMSTTEID